MRCKQAGCYVVLCICAAALGQTASAPAAKQPDAGSAYTIKQGDVLGTIAKEFGVTVSQIEAANPGLDANRLQINQIIHIPPSGETEARAAVASFADAVRAGNEDAAMKCWTMDVKGDADEAALWEGVARGWVKWSIASAHLDQAMAKMFPESRKDAKTGTMTPEQIKQAHVVMTGRSGTVQWGEGPWNSLSVVEMTDDSGKSVWKISLQKWHEEHSSSVGDARMLAGWEAQAMDLLAKDLLDGKAKSPEDIQGLYLARLNEIMAAEEKKKSSSAPATTRSQ